MTELGGYLGRLLRVDLSAERIWVEPLNADYARRFVGGSGLAARYLWDLAGPATDPLGPANPLIFMTGPLVGTDAPATGRFSVAARSPQTGLTGEANSGGSWGPALRQAGFDGIVITGCARRPLYLSVLDGEARLHEAAHLWGLDSYELQDRIKTEIGAPRACVAGIGAAGENGVRFAAVMNDNGRAAGRTGMGAVMGSKRLKAIAVAGHSALPLADPASYKAAVRATRQFVKDDIFARTMGAAGTIAGADVGYLYGDVPFRYFTTGESPAVEASVNTAALTRSLVRRRACFRCPIACNREVRVPRSGLERIDGPEYETTIGFSALIGASSVEDAAVAGHLCNRHGLDTISCSGVIALLYALYDLGIASREAIGLPLRWGDPAPVPRLIELIARREGIGALAAAGALALATHFGVPYLAVQVKNLEVPYHDPRAFLAQGLIYATASRGADHMAGDCYEVGRGRTYPDLAINLIDRHEQSAAQAAQAARLMDFRALTNSAILCHFEDPLVDNLIALLDASLGIATGREWILRTGERITHLKRALNFRFGATRDADTLPQLLRRPLATGNSGGQVLDLDAMLAEFYAYRGWDGVTGKPLPERLAALDLPEVVDALW